MYEIRWHKGLGQYVRGEFETLEATRKYLIWLRALHCEAAVYHSGHQVGAVVSNASGRWIWWLADPPLATVA